jgi:hypothetical protein
VLHISLERWTIVKFASCSELFNLIYTTSIPLQVSKHVKRFLCGPAYREVSNSTRPSVVSPFVLGHIDVVARSCSFYTMLRYWRLPILNAHFMTNMIRKYLG